jgi:hypothetical protein
MASRGFGSPTRGIARKTREVLAQLDQVVQT